MKKTYITPNMIEVVLDNYELIATSPQGGLDDGDSVGNQTPDGDDDDNIFTKGETLWDEEW